MRKIIFMLATMMTFSMTAFAAETAPAQEQAPMEISASVDEAQSLRDTSYSFDFGSVQVGMSSYRRFNLTNSGDLPLRIGQFQMYGADFDAYASCPRVLRPRMACQFQVEFRPLYEGFKSGDLFIRTNGGNINVHLTGFGTRY